MLKQIIILLYHILETLHPCYSNVILLDACTTVMGSIEKASEISLTQTINQIFDSNITADSLHFGSGNNTTDCRGKK